MVFMRKWMVESPFQAVLRCFENVLRRNVPTSGSKEPDVGTFLYNIPHGIQEDGEHQGVPPTSLLRQCSVFQKG